MPVIVTADHPHPFLTSLGDTVAIEAERARHQDIRPMEIAIINLMADKVATERQLAQWLGNSPLQVHLTFATTDSYVDSLKAGRMPRSTPEQHLRQFYSPWRDIQDRKFDGLIITGINALQPTVTAETYWPDMQRILAWSETNVLSSLFLCWGAKAALKHFHDIESDKGDQKTFGLFDHRLKSDTTGLLFGLPDQFSVPVSRWKNPRRAEVEACAALEIVADSAESGPNILVESAAYDDGMSRYPKRVYILNHPEYETDTLKREYERDVAMNPRTPLPLHYFPGNDPTQTPINTWRHTAMIYTNWVKAIYEATNFDLGAIPEPYRRHDAASHLYLDKRFG